DCTARRRLRRSHTTLATEKIGAGLGHVGIYVRDLERMVTFSSWKIDMLTIVRLFCGGVDNAETLLAPVRALERTPTAACGLSAGVLACDLGCDPHVASVPEYRCNLRLSWLCKKSDHAGDQRHRFCHFPRQRRQRKGGDSADLPGLRPGDGRCYRILSQSRHDAGVFGVSLALCSGLAVPLP